MSEISTVLNLVEKLGWQSVPIKGGWQLGHPNVEGVIYLSMTSQWLILAYPLSLVEKKSRQWAGHLDSVRINRKLLEQNEHMYMVKFSLDDEEYPLLMVEVPAKSSLQHSLKWALDGITQYASKYNTSEWSEQVVPPDGAVTRILEGGTTYLPDDTPGVPKETIARYLKGIEANQWGVRTTPQGLGLNWHLGYKGRLRVFDVYLTISKNWTYFQIPMLLERIPSVLMEDIHVQNLFYKYLLQLNYIWFMAKLGLTAEGYLILLLEVPTEMLDFTLFQQATGTLSTYLDGYIQEIQIMASLHHDQELVELLNSMA